MLATQNILERTFRILYDGVDEATCFTLDIDNRQYIITTRISVGPTGKVQIERNDSWEDYTVNLVGHEPKNVSNLGITVLAPDRQLSPTHPLPAVTKRVNLGQDVLFLGFPNGFAAMSSKEVKNTSIPPPTMLVKHGIVSGAPVGENKTYLLDGHNNPGFFGGPVVYERVNNESKNKELAVIGIIKGMNLNLSDEYSNDSGIIHASDISCALDLIDEKPIGFELPTP